MRRTPQQWQALIQQQRESAGSIKDFCLKQGIAASSFYKYKIRVPTHSETNSSSPFLHVTCIEPETLSPPHSISLNIGKVTMTLDCHTDVHWLASLVRQLA